MPMNAAWLRIRAGEAISARIALLGDRISSTHLLELGLVTEVVADDATLSRAREIAGQMAKYPAGAAARVKSELRAQSTIGAPEEWFRLASGGSLRGVAAVR